MADIVEDFRQAIAHVYKRKGATVLPVRDFKFCVSMDFNWFPPAQAGTLIEVATKMGLLRETESGLEPSFSLGDVSIQPDFRPSPDLLSYKPAIQPLFIRIVNNIVRDTGMKKNEIVSVITRKKDLLNIESDVAALLVAREHGVDVREFLPETRELLQNASKQAVP